MADEEHGATATQEAGSEPEEHPRGTMLLSLLFLMLLVGMWFSVYFMLLEQG